MGNTLESAAEVKQEQEKDNKREDVIKSTLESSLAELKALRKDMKSGGILDILVIGASLLSGFTVGLVQKIVSFFKPVLSLFKGSLKIVDTVVDAFNVGWTKFTGVLKSITSIFTENTLIQKVVGVFKRGWTYFADIFKEIGTVINTISDMLAVVFSKGKQSVGMFAKFITSFVNLFDTFSIFFKVGKLLGNVIGKLAIPLQVIMSVFDLVSGSLDGWANTEGSYAQKFLGALKGGLTKLLNGLIGGLLDLLKDGVSWVLNILRWKNASKALDSFSFSDLITKVVSGMFGFVNGLIDFVVNLFTKPDAAMAQLQGLADMATEFIKKVLRGVLPNPSGNGPAAWAAKAIPDSVYEFAGMNPKTGAIVAETPSTGMATKAIVAETPSTGMATKALEKTTSENTDAKTENATKVALAASAASMNNSSSSQVVNNNTTQTAILKSKSTNWEPDDQWARSGLAWGA
jgi:hypothetical protein